MNSWELEAANSGLVAPVFFEPCSYLLAQWTSTLSSLGDGAAGIVGGAQFEVVCTRPVEVDLAEQVEIEGRQQLAISLSDGSELIQTLARKAWTFMRAPSKSTVPEPAQDAALRNVWLLYIGNPNCSTCLIDLDLLQLKATGFDANAAGGIAGNPQLAFRSVGNSDDASCRMDEFHEFELALRVSDLRTDHRSLSFLRFISGLEYLNFVAISTQPRIQHCSRRSHPKLADEANGWFQSGNSNLGSWLNTGELEKEVINKLGKKRGVYQLFVTRYFIGAA